MLQGVRAFGLDRLRATGELSAAQAAHSTWAVEVAEQAARDLADDEQSTVWRLVRCLDDLRAAHHWLVAFDADEAMRLIHALHPYAFWHGRTEVFRWAEVVAALDSTSPMRASVKASVCAGAWIRGDLRTADHAARAALAAVTEPASPMARRAFEQAGEVALQRGDADQAVAMYDRALHLSLLVDDHMQAIWDLGSSALVLGYTGQFAEADRRAALATEMTMQVTSPSARSFAAFVRGEIAATRDPADARAHLQEAIELAESIDNRFIAALGRVTLASLDPEGGHDLGAAIEHYTSALASWDNAGAWFAQLVTLRNVVGLLASRGAVDDAATLYGAVIAGARTASPIYGADRLKIERTRTTIAHQLGEERAARLASIGASLSPQEVIAFTLRALQDCRRRAH
jgi:tetratricopeptide (TPR) repeat protein